MGTKKTEVTELGHGVRDQELAALIDKGVLLKKREARTKKELGNVKEAIQKRVKNKEGKWLTPKGGYLCITEREQFGEIDPAEAFTFLKSKRRGPDFFGCIKVMFEKFKAHADEADLERLRPKAASTLQFSFKQEGK